MSLQIEDSGSVRTDEKVPKSEAAFRDSPIIINQTCSRYDYDLVFHAYLSGYAIDGDDVDLTGWDSDVDTVVAIGYVN